MIDLNISLEDEATVTGTKDPIIDLALNNKTPQVSGEEANRRGFLYHVALDSDTPGLEETTNAVLSGQEDNLKEKVATKALKDKKDAANSLVQTVADTGVDPSMAVDILKAGNTPVNKETEVYKQYAKHLLDLVGSSTDNEEVHKAEDAAPIDHEDFNSATSDILAISEGLKSLREDTANRYKDVGWGSTIFSVGKQMVPFYNWYQINTDLPDSGVTGLPYSNLEKEITNLYTLPPDQAIERARTIVDQAFERDPMIAMQIADSLVSFNSSDTALNNILEIANLPGWGMAAKVAKGLGKGAKAAKAVGELEKTLEISKGIRSRTVANSIDGLSTPEILSDAGRVEEAAKVSVLTKSKALNTTENVSKTARLNKGVVEIAENLPTLYDPNAITRGATRYGKVFANNLEMLLNKNTQQFTRLLSQPNKVSVFPDGWEAALVNKTAEEVKQKYNKITDAIYSVQPYFSNENYVGISGVETTFLTKEGKFFKTEAQAIRTAEDIYGFKPGSYSLAQEGDGYSIKVATDVDPSNKEFLDTVISTENQSNSRWALPLDLLRGNPKDFLPTHIVEQRGTAVHGYSLAESIAGDAFEPIRALSKDEHKALNKVMAFNRDALTKPGDPDSRGMFYNNLNEFDEGFYSVNGRFPSEKEATAYFMFVRAHEIDYFLRNINAVQEKWAKGIKKFSFKLNDADISIEGKRVDTVPSPDKGPADILFVDPKTGKGTARQLTNKLKEEIDKLAKEKNYSVIQTYDGFIDETPVNFVVLKSEVENPISFRQVNYRPGFHSVYEAENKIVQPEIVRSGSREYYKGDKIAYMLSTRRGAEKVLENINHARELLKDKNIPALTDHLNRTLPISVEDFTKGFGKGGFSLDAPFTMVRSGEKSINTDSVKALYPNASDFKENPYILNKGDDLTFTLERGRVIKELSPKADGVWGIEDAKQVDPVAVQNREMSRLIRNRFYEPLTTATANSFIEEFGKKGMLSMKGRTLTVDEMRRNPTWYFHNADIVTSSPVNRKKMELIRNAHRRLVGQPSKIESDYLSFVHRFEEGLSHKFGGAIASKAIPLIRNPIKYMKAVAFYTKMGFYNPVQMFVQSATFANIAAIAPKHALGGTMAAIAQSRLAFTEAEDIVEYVAKHYSKAMSGGLSKEEFLDSYLWLKKSGMDIVSNEHAYTAGISDPKLFVSKLGKKFLDKSTFFFNHTERMLRMSAWNTAYKEYTSQFPKLAGRISAADAKKIQIRAEALTGNMSRDATAFWQAGLAAPITQFYGYYWRMVDLLTGTQLSRAEKARLMFSFGALYGSNYAASIVYGAANADPMAVVNQFNPFGEDIRTYALEQGKDINDGVIGLFANGIPATIIAAATGKQVNYGDRYGLGGANDVFQNMRDAFAEHESPFLGFLQASTGASGDIINSIVSSAIPAFGYLLHAGSMPTEVAKDAIIKTSRNVSTVNQAANLVSALETGSYYSKNGNELANGIDPLEALFYSISGLSPQSISDTFSMSKITKYRQERIRTVKNELRPMIRHYLEAYNEGNIPKVKELSTYIDAELRKAGVLPSQIPRVYVELLNADPLFEGIQKQFVNGSPDPETQLRRQELINSMQEQN